MSDISDEMLNRYGAHPEDEPTHVSNFIPITDAEFLDGLESTPLKEPNDYKQWWKKDMSFLKK